MSEQDRQFYTEQAERLARLETINDHQMIALTEIKETVRDFAKTCAAKHAPLNEDITDLKAEVQRIATKQKAVLGGLVLTLTGIVMAFWEWLFGGLSK